MSFPQLIFEWSPTTNPFATPSWVELVDANGYDVLRSYKLKRGRQKWLDKIQPSTGTVVLRNRDGSLTFGSANPNVSPIRRCRIRAVYNSTSYTRFTGFFNSLALAWSRDESFVTAQIYDGLALLALGPLAAPYPLNVAAVGPLAQYRMQETTGASLAADSSGNGLNGSYVGSPAFGVAGPIVDQAAKAVTMDATDYLQTAVLNAISGTASFSLVVWVKNVAPGSPIAALAPSSGFPWQVYANGLSGDPSLIIDNTGNLSGAVANLGDGNWHQLVLGRDTVGGKAYLYCDTVLALNPSLGTLVSYPASPVSFASAGATIMAEPTFYPFVLSAAQVAADYAAASAWLNQNSGTRISTVAGLVGWNAADESIDTGASTLANASDLASQAALQHFLNVAAAENGMVFINQAGQLRFISRWNLQKSPYNTPQAVFGDAGGSEVSYDLAGLLPVADDIDIWNVIQMARKDGSTLTARAAAAQIAQYGPPRTQQLQTIVSSDYEAQNAAMWELIQDEAALQRFEQLNLTGYAANYAALFARELGDLITVKGSPPNTGGGRLSQNVRILGMSEQADAKTRKLTATWNLWPREPQMLLISDANFGQIGGPGFTGNPVVIGY